ncbi:MULTISPECIES: Txe/YoeB family addiction module toxin [Oceanibaculum]|uniref:Putative mRNA interferase YoeB n=1 Tax=Oceanibaculum indicum TaxID=526216 RepID=A0A420WNE2_9PROT|nr:MULTISPECIES: Txe/YoeB family addiction module toxin [Oceanibaculum]MCH2395538.1 Txe/YoeB family addiction module toxin [Oceanibaculum sp.]RKQ72539.1 toxin YoeB [Oceanibaculum indicum]
MKIVWTPGALEDFHYWQTQGGGQEARIKALLADIRQTPFSGIGKPEPLRGNLQGWWSRRITQEHRLIYRIAGSGSDQRIEVLACRYHY